MPGPAEFSRQATIEVDGAALREEVRPQLERVVVDDHVRQPAMFLISLLDTKENAVLGQTGLRIGSRVTISGSTHDDPAPVPLIQGEVTGIEAEYDQLGQRIVVRGYDPAHTLQRGRVTATYQDVTDTDLVRAVARRAGVTTGTLDESPVVYEHVAQSNRSDWEFLSERARRIGFDLCFRDGKLEFRDLRRADDAPDEGDHSSTVPLQLVMGQELVEFRPRLTAAQQVSEIEVRGWDGLGKTTVSAVGAASAASAVLTARPGSVGASFGAARLVTTPAADTHAAVEGLARSVAERLGSAFAEATGVTVGLPTLRAGSAFSVGLVEEQFRGKYVATATRHVFDQAGYRTEFTVSGRQDRDLLGLLSAPARADRIEGVVVGLVSGIDDPEHLGRVKLKLPWLADDFESGWARLMAPGAGPSTGVAFLPDVGDEVLVAFQQGDIDHPVVLGGLWNRSDAPPLGAQLVGNGVARRVLMSRAGHRLVFVDEAGSHAVEIQTADGANRVVLSDDGIRIEAATTLELHASDVRIKADSGLDLEAVGRTTVTGAQVAVRADATVDIDGGLITLN